MNTSTKPDLHLIAAFARWVAHAAPQTTRFFAGLFVLYMVATLLSLVTLIPMLALLGLGGLGGKAGSAEAMLTEWLSGLGGAAVPLVLGTYFVIAATGAAIRYVMALRTSQLRETCLLHLRQDIYRTLLETRWQAQARISDADCNRVLTEEAGRIALVIELAVSALLDTALLAVLFVVAFWLSWPMALAALAAGLLLFAALTPLRRRAAVAGDRLGQEVTAFHRLTAASLTSRKQIRVLQRESESHRNLGNAAAKVGDAHDRQRRAEAGTSMGLDLGMEAVLVLLVVGLVLWAQAASGILFLLLYCAVRGLHVLGSAHRSWASFLANLPAFGRVQALRASLQGDLESGRTAIVSQPSVGATEAASVDLQGVSVCYAGEVEPAIRDIHLSIRPGELIALVGPSGSGKTTLADLCAGIVLPDAGVCRTLSRHRAATIGYVGQEGGLLPSSIRDNLLWSAPCATEQDCWDAIDGADAGFVRELEAGLDTQIGATRSRFSGGEQRRLSLACALVRKPELLILDEATSQLDAESERRVIAALLKTRLRCTILLVTHRLATTMICDRILEMQRGRIAQFDRFDRLAAKPGFFRRACEQQGLKVPSAAIRSNLIGEGSAALSL